MKRKLDIPCKNCGKYFHPTRLKSIFCCRECGIAYNKAHGKYKKSEETKAKLSAAHKGKTPWNKGRKMTEEEIDKMKASVKAAWTEEKKEAQRLKQKEVWSNPELLAKHSARCKEHMTEEYKQFIAEKTMEAMATDIVKQHMHESFNRPEVKEKRMKTNQERYGVNWIVQSTLYTKENFKGETNNKWDAFLNIPNKSREYPIENYIYDFKINNTLIEINPTYTHNSTNTTWYNNKYIVETDYHLTKSQMAWKHGFECIHVWDWDNKYKIKNLLISPKYSVNYKECQVKQVDMTTAIEFLHKYSIINATNDITLAIGIYYENVLITVSTYTNNTNKNISDYKLLNFANNGEYISYKDAIFILHIHFIAKYNPTSIAHYNDNSKFDKTLFEKLGYIPVHTTKPISHLYNTQTKLHYISTNIDNAFKNNLLDNNYVEVYDCGQTEYIWKDPNLLDE